jgi:hypothetical protein
VRENRRSGTMVAERLSCSDLGVVLVVGEVG